MIARHGKPLTQLSTGQEKPCQGEGRAGDGGSMAQEGFATALQRAAISMPGKSKSSGRWKYDAERAHHSSPEGSSRHARVKQEVEMVIAWHRNALPQLSRGKQKPCQGEVRRGDGGSMARGRPCHSSPEDSDSHARFKLNMEMVAAWHKKAFPQLSRRYHYTCLKRLLSREWHQSDPVTCPGLTADGTLHSCMVAIRLGHSSSGSLAFPAEIFCISRQGATEQAFLH
ncbi:hypothetical protein NDU88_008183 [Pleurodeles waltl]|uniref:Uncharacterized protein n=1 Tax=Pleurodeles waltl TaxID=8319 RepID=A0AAV7N8E4_PLEWA|nr:hypothetical protein NDU88_008183 [Pleurodeles waltl]